MHPENQIQTTDIDKSLVVVLIVEDEPGSALLIKRTIQKLGYQAIHAKNSDEAMRLVEEQQPYIILMDITLVGSRLNGVEIAEWVGDNYGTPVIFLTGEESPDMFQKAMMKHVVGYTLKPVKFWDLQVMLEFALYRHFTNQELWRQHEALRQEKEKSEKLLLNILPAATAEELKQYGSAKPKSYDLVSVMFCDLKGFTKISEHFTPEKLVEQLENCFSHFDDIITRNGLEKIKTIGDGYMCAGGIPLPKTTNPFDTVRAALEMQEFMKELETEHKKKDLPIWKLRIGVHTGKVIAGVIGTKKFAYDIWGSTVNLASRLESGGEEYRVNISGVTYEYVKDTFECEYRGKIFAKNVGDVDMFFVNKER